MKISLKLIVLLSTLFIEFSLAQESPEKLKNGFAVGIKGHYGFIIPHSESIAEQAFSNPRIIEAEVSWHLNKEKIWQNFGTYPRVGASVFLIDFDNLEVLGQGIGIVPFFEPYLSVDRKLNPSFRMGIGLIYLNQVFDEQSNPENLFYSTPISFLLHLNFNLSYKISEKMNLKFGGYYNHISNGGVQVPNKGINFPTASLGMEYMIRPNQFPQQTKKNWREIHKEPSRFKASIFATATNVEEGDNQRYPIIGTMFYYQRIFSRLSALNLGVEWVWDGATQEKAMRESQSTNPNKVSFLLGHELLLGRFRFSQMLGFYVFNEREIDSRIYQRYGLDFYFTEKLFTGISLKSHGDIADFMDFRLGYTF